MKIAILTSPNQWFVPYAKILNEKLRSSKLYFNHEDILDNYDIVFILSYHKIIPKEYLSKHHHNIVIHASELPQGKGWSPMFWQIFEGKNEIPFSMFEVDEGVDSGNIYLLKVLKLAGYELNGELRDKQANFTIEMCLDFVANYDNYKISKPQIGQEIFYPKRSEKDSKLDINKSLKEQFNLLRIVDNENYPAYFEIDGYRYILKIELQNGGGTTLLNFINLSIDEKKMILKWRNNPNIKKYMYTKDDISLENHLKFIDSLKNSKDELYFIVKKDDEYIGVIDFVNIKLNESLIMGIYTNPNLKGNGKILLETIINFSFNIIKVKKIFAEVFFENEKAFSLYKTYGFKEYADKIINNKKVICMELKNEK